MSKSKQHPDTFRRIKKVSSLSKKGDNPVDMNEFRDAQQLSHCHRIKLKVGSLSTIQLIGC